MRIPWFRMFCDTYVADENWVLRKYTDRVRIRERYLPLQCKACLKIDELLAIKSGFDEDVRVRSPYELFRTCDDLLCASKSVREFFKANRLSGMRFAPLPCGRFSILHPGRFAQIRDVESSGVRVLRPCRLCGRAKEQLGTPRSENISWPSRSTQCAFLWPSNESLFGRRYSLIVSEAAMRLLKRTSIKALRLKFDRLS